MMTAADAAVRKFHVSLNVSDLGRSVAFYRALFGAEPAKQYADYAKFEVDDPPLVLSLIPSGSVGGGSLNHAGLRLPSSEQLVEVQRRMEEAGYSTRREDGVACCYARQTKFWIVDPDKTLWEVYTFHEDLDHRGEGMVPEQHAFAKDVPRERLSWEHRIPSPLGEAIPHEANSLDDVSLEGSCNLAGAWTGLVKEAFRALRPGGRLRIRGLMGDRELAAPLPPLPGPASVVERVPAWRQAREAMADAGFAGVWFDTLSRVHFTVAGVALREVCLVGQKPGYRPKKPAHRVVYLGPLAQVVDDFGNVFPKGEIVALNVHDWQALSKSGAAEQFRLLEDNALPVMQDSCCA